MAPPESVHASFIAHSAYLEHHSYCQPETEKKETKKKKGKEIGVGDVSLWVHSEKKKKGEAYRMDNNMRAVTEKKKNRKKC